MTKAPDAQVQRVDLRPGEVVAVGRKLYGRCAGCGEIVCVNKWILGSLHLCAPSKEDPHE